MKTIVLSYDRMTRTLSASGTDAGSVVDNATTTLHIDPIPGATMDLVFGVVIRDGDRLKRYPFSRVDANGDAVLFSDVLSACTGGALPVSLRLTYDNNAVEVSTPIILKVRMAPNADIESQVQYSDLALTRNSSLAWDERWLYSVGSVVTHQGALWLAKTSSVASEPREGSADWVRVSADTKAMTALEGVRGNVQQQLDAKQERIMTIRLAVPFGGWVKTEEGWAQTIYHVGLKGGHEVRVSWERPDYLECWVSDVRIESITDGSAVIVVTDKPQTTLSLVITEWI